jgi:hypothetical protein
MNSQETHRAHRQRHQRRPRTIRHTPQLVIQRHPARVTRRPYPGCGSAKGRCRVSATLRPLPTEVRRTHRPAPTRDAERASRSPGAQPPRSATDSAVALRSVGSGTAVARLECKRLSAIAASKHWRSAKTALRVVAADLSHAPLRLSRDAHVAWAAKTQIHSRRRISRRRGSCQSGQPDLNLGLATLGVNQSGLGLAVMLPRRVAEAQLVVHDRASASGGVALLKATPLDVRHVTSGACLLECQAKPRQSPCGNRMWRPIRYPAGP